MLLNACSFSVQENADEASVRPAWWSPGTQWPWGKKIKEPLGDKQQRPTHQRGPILGKATWLTLMLTWREEGTE